MKTNIISSAIFAVTCAVAISAASFSVNASQNEQQISADNRAAISAMEHAGFLSGVELQGTAGLTGIHIGSYRLYAWLSGEGLMAEGTDNQAWFWDFDNKKVTFGAGTIKAKRWPFPSFKYETHQPVSFTDNGDGTYTVDYGFQVHHWLFGNPKGRTETTFKITKLDGQLHFEVLDIEADGHGDGTVGTKFSGIFPKEVQLEWRGQ
ncbi:MAG: hypothetical protein GY787_25530 [Alteromonadales bacterium]|nr:hypothetical protein [Alteromonadales bacterium]